MHFASFDGVFVFASPSPLLPCTAERMLSQPFARAVSTKGSFAYSKHSMCVCARERSEKQIFFNAEIVPAVHFRPRDFACHEREKWARRRDLYTQGSSKARTNNDEPRWLEWKKKKKTKWNKEEKPHIYSLFSSLFTWFVVAVLIFHQYRN